MLGRIETDDTYTCLGPLIFLSDMLRSDDVHTFMVQFYVAALLGCVALVVGPNTSGFGTLHHWTLNKAHPSSMGWTDLIHTLRTFQGTDLWAAFRLETTR